LIGGRKRKRPGRRFQKGARVVGKSLRFFEIKTHGHLLCLHSLGKSCGHVQKHSVAIRHPNANRSLRGFGWVIEFCSRWARHFKRRIGQSTSAQST
jgi:hypothetical protein